MDNLVRDDNDRLVKINWLIFFRIIFTVFLLGSTIFVQQENQLGLPGYPLKFLYSIITGVFILSAGYIVFKKYSFGQAFSYVQLNIDTFIVSLIIFATGTYSSIFSFLYLLVIAYSSILLSRKGCMYIAATSSIQYGLILELEYYGVLVPFLNQSLPAVDLVQVTYKIIITMIACFSVAFMSSFLAEQARSSRRELTAMEENVRRVQRLAYMGEMAAGLAHEIKNPLAAMTSSIQILKEELSLESGQEKLMRIILREADRLNSLVADFLLFAKPSSGNIIKISAGEMITEILDLFQKNKSMKKKIIISTEMLEDFCIDIDPVHFRQILWNLLLNAAESMPDENGKIHIRMRSLQNGYGEISIEDTGKGISPEDINLIFNPFFTTKIRGTGLGLSIVHRLVENYGGRIDVESMPNHGTVMKLRLKKSK